MHKEIIINADKEQTRIAIKEDGELVELFIESTENTRTLGDIYLARVRKIMPSIQAAFVDIGQKQDAFLHFSDLSDNLQELLDFVDDDEPQVGKGANASASGGGESKGRGRRRRPRGGRRSKKDGEAEAGDEAAADAVLEPENGAEAEGDDAAGDEKKRSPHKSAAESHARGQRRQAQQRAKRKPPSAKQAAKASREPDEDDEGIPKRNPDVRPETLLKRDQRILVKIVKEPISNKGSRVSTDISLAGRFLVLVPLADYVAVSKKIYSYKERRRLRALAKSLLPEGFGVIVRTVAEGKNAKALDTDLRLLLEKWRKIEKKLSGRPDPPVHVHQDVNMVSSVIRDLFSDDYDQIMVDDERHYRNIKSYVQAVAPHLVPVVKLHKGKQHIFETCSIARDVTQAFESRVDLPTGGYLFIERTEAMHVIDVNSGRSGRGMTQEENSLKVNLESARIIAKQIRLRDLGGIIVVDFIDLRDERNKRKVYDELKKEFKKDRAVSKILPMSDFGLVQITRQRLRPSITTTFAPPNGLTSSEKGGGNGKKEERAEAEPAEGGRRSSGRNEGDRSDRGDASGRGEGSDRGGNSGRNEGDRSGRGGSGRGRNRESRRDERGDGSHDAIPAEPSLPDRTPAELLAAMEQWLVQYRVQGNRGGVILCVHPFTAAYLNRKVPNYPTRWFMKHLVRIRLEADESLPPLTYRFLDTRDRRDITEAIGEPSLAKAG